MRWPWRRRAPKSDPDQPGTLSVTRLVNPAAFADPVVGPDLRRLFAVAFPERTSESIVFLVEHLKDERLAVFVARRGEMLRGVAVAADWTTPLTPLPWVLHFFAPQDRGVRIVLAREVTAWIRSRGHTSAAAINASGLDDERWLSGFRQAAAPIAVRSYFELDVTGGA